MEPLTRNSNIVALFRHRMERLGRTAELESRVKAHTIENDPLSTGRAIWKVMKEMGYKDAKEERWLFEQWRREQAATANESRVVRISSELLAGLEKIPHLPAVASPASEFEWVGGHPAMMRQDLQRDKTVEVHITMDDVVNAPHGPAPSRRAVTMLVNWANRTAKFHDQMIAEHKKAAFVGNEDQTNEASHDPTLKEVREMIERMEADGGCR